MSGSEGVNVTKGTKRARNVRAFLLQWFVQVLLLEPLAGSEDSDAAVFREHQQVIVAGDDAIGLAGNCRGEHRDIVRVPACVFGQCRGSNDFHALDVSAKERNIFGSDLELFLELVVQFVQQGSRGDQDMVFQTSAYQIPTQAVGD